MDIRDAVSEVSTMICIAWAVQEKMFVVLDARLVETHGTRAMESFSKSTLARITKLDS